MPKLRYDIRSAIHDCVLSGITSSFDIAKTTGLHLRTVQLYLKETREEQSRWLDFLARGGYIQKFKQTLDTFDYQANELGKELLELKATYKVRNLMLNDELGSEGLDARRRTAIFQDILNNDNFYFSNLEKFRRFIKDTEKDSLVIQSKTAIVWSFDQFVKKNTPIPIEDPTAALGDIIDEGGTLESLE